MALANIDTVSVAEALMSAYSRVGIPKQILSDRGTQFAWENSEVVICKNYREERFYAIVNKMLKRMSRATKRVA